MMPYYMSRGLKLHFESLGDGPPVLLVHGFTNYGLVWTPQAVALAHSGFRVLMPDLAGHGLSDVVEQETTVSELATDMVTLLDTLGIDRIAVCGLSLGGMIAQQIVVDHPNRISAMLVANSRAENVGMRPAVEGWITEFEGKGGPLARLEKTYPNLTNERFRSGPAGEATLELWRLVLSRVAGRSLANVARGMMNFDVTEKLPDVRIPTLVVTGTEDKLIPPDLSRRTAELVPGATFEIIPGAGHISSMDSAVAFNRILFGFLSEAEGVPGL
jgi:3-oxoadipate enol-lactonase